MQQQALDNRPGGRDLVGHSSVQAWSAGPLFPAVIAQVECYEEFDRVAAAKDALRDYPGLGGPEGRVEEAMRERAFYARPLPQRLRHVSFELTYPGRKPELYATWADAERVALYYKALDEADKVVGEGARAEALRRVYREHAEGVLEREVSQTAATH